MSENNTEEISVTFESGAIREQHVRDVKNVEDCPPDLDFQIAPGVIVASASRKSIRWLYDYLQHLARAWRAEGEQWDADTAEEMAETLWKDVDGDLPDQQRNRRTVS